MTDLFSLEDLSARLQADIDIATGTLARDGATAVIAALTGGHSFTGEVSETEVMTGGGCRVLQLSHWPVTDVTSIKVDDVALAETDYVVTTAGNLTRALLWWGVPPSWGFSKIEVQYTHGYAAVPAIIEEAALEIASSLYGNPQLLRQLVAGTVTEYYAQSLVAPEFVPILKAYQ